MINIDGIEVGWKEPCRVVAEVSNNHNGCLDRAIRIIDGVKAAGADFVKFQCYTPDELVALRGDGPAPAQWSSMSMRDLYTKAQTPLDWFPALFAHARKIGITPFSSVFGAESMEVLQSVDCPAYKVARLDNHHDTLRRMLKATDKPVIVSTGGEDTTIQADLYLWCPEGYPQKNINLKHSTFEHYNGFSYHGTSAMPLMIASTFGALMVETHVQLDDEPSELEANISITMTQLRALTDFIKAPK